MFINQLFEKKDMCNVCGQTPCNCTSLNEGEVVQFPKKHKGDISDMHSCPKCGGDLQGGKYMGHEVQVCMPCKQVYLPPNSGIDQQGNKIQDEGVAEGSGPKKFKVTYKLQNGEVKEKIMIGKDASTVAKYFEFKYRHKPTSVVEQGVAEGLNDTQKKIEDTINKLEDRLKHAKSGEQWDRISARIERLQARLKRSKQGAAGLESGAKILYTGKDKSGTVTISYEPDYIPGHSEKYIIRFDGKVKSEMPTLRSAVYGLTHYQVDTFRPNLQPNPKTALEQGVDESRAITPAADISTGAKKLWQYISRNLVDLASTASFYADRNETYIEERLTNLLKTSTGQPIQIAFDMSSNIEFEKGTLYIPIGVMYRYRGSYTSSRFVNDVTNVIQSQQQGVAEGSLNEFAPGDSGHGDDRTYEYEVYQCNPDDQFDWIGGPIYKSDDMGKVHGIAYNLHKKYPNKAFMIWQERSQGSRGGYGIKDDEQGVAEGSPTMWEVCFDYGPHMSDTVKVKAGSEDEAIAKVEKAAEKRGRNIDINWAKPAEQGVEEGVGTDMAKLGGIAALGVGGALVGNYSDTQQPKVEIGGQIAFVEPSYSNVPDSAMTLTGKDGNTYRVWATKGTAQSSKRYHAVPVKQVKEQGVEEGSRDTVQFEVDSENAYNHIMGKFGSIINWNGDTMVAPRKYWGTIQELAYAAGGEASEVGDEQDVEEGADERNHNALWAQITDYEKRQAKAERYGRDTQAQHFKQMADQLRAKLPTNDNPINELSNDKLAQYKTAAGADASAADKRGDYDHGNKRFSGIVKATNKQFANDAKKHK
jgi:hypothetical protein